MSRRDYDFFFKIIVVGNAAVGKSSLMIRYVEDTFSDDVPISLGVDFYIKNIVLKGKNIRVQVWDSAGQERFRTVTSSFYQGTHGALLVYDISNKDSFKDSKQWMEEIKRYTGSLNPVLYFVGNKLDLQASRQVKTEKAMKYATKMQINFAEASAKDSTNVTAIFTELVEKILSQQAPLTEDPKSGRIKLSLDSGSKKASKKRCTLL